MTEFTTLLAVVGAVSLVIAFILEILYRVIRAAMDLGKSWVAIIPEVPGAQAELKRIRINRGTFTKKVKFNGDTELERWITSDTAGYPTRKGPLYVVGAATGWNLVAPSKRDLPKLITSDGKPATEATEQIYARMLVADPLIYERAVEENDFEDFLAAKQNKDPWQVRILPLVCIVLLIAMVIIGILVWYGLKAAQAAHGAA